MPNHPNMQYRSLGRCGLKVSALSLGGWTTFGQSVTDISNVKAILHRAFDCGINFFDIADVYGLGQAEQVMGAVFKDFPRHELIISSKVFFPMSDDVNDKGLSRKHIMESVERSLKRIGTDHLDLYFCHRYDPETPIEETVRAMDDLVRQGKVIYWGTSSWNGGQLLEAYDFCRERGFYRPQVEQPRYNLLMRNPLENDVFRVVEEARMGVVTYSPLAFGFLTGKYDDGIPAGTRLEREGWLKDKVFLEENFQRVRAMKALAERLGCSRAQLSIAWVAAQKGISSVITGATSVQQLDDNLGSLKVPVSRDVLNELDRLFPAGEAKS